MATVILSQLPRTSSTTWMVLALAGLILYSSVNAVINYRRLRQFKGPLLACVSELWLFKETWKGNVYAANAAALEKYGSPARIGPNLIVTDDPVLYKAMNAPRSAFTRGHFYSGMKFDPRLDNVLSERDEKRHAELRTQLHAGYGGREIPMMESNVDARVVDLIDLIKREYTGKVVDLARVSQYFTLDVLTELAFGHPFGFLAQNGDIYDYIKTCAAFFPLMELRCNIPLISAIVTSRPAERVLALITSDDVGLGAVISLARKVVAERYGPDAPAKQDMLGSFISHGVSQRQAECESVLLLLAGSDSTATALRCTFLWILTNPTVYSKLVSEIDAAAAKNVLSSPVIADAEAKALPYLQACIREGLRVFPPLQGIADKLTPPGGETVGGVFIPGGTRVAFNSYQLMRRPDIWGPDAHLFRPERWLEAAPDARLRYDRTWELSFGHGRSTCLGRNIALMELGKVFVELLRHYDWGIANPLRPIKTRCNGAHVQSGMWLSASPRRQEVS